MTEPSSSFSAETSLIHIGLPKTASTALDIHFFPNLGVPYQPKDHSEATRHWYKAIRYAADFVALPYEGRRIISGENLCDPGKFGSAEVARRLRMTYSDALILLVVREPHEHFVSHYRHSLRIRLTVIGDDMQKYITGNDSSRRAMSLLPDINAFFDDALRNRGSFYFRLMHLDRNIAAFKEHFRTLVVDYGLIVKNFSRFKDVVCGALDLAAPSAALPSENAQDTEGFKDLVARIPEPYLEAHARARLIASYAAPELSPDRLKFFLDLIHQRCATTYAEAIRD